MLVLKREQGQSILLQLADGRQIKIILVSLRRPNVRIGIEAPLDVKISRPDVPARTADAALAAAAGDAGTACRLAHPERKGVPHG